jgi:hypothetical protein
MIYFADVWLAGSYSLGIYGKTLHFPLMLSIHILECLLSFLFFCFLKLDTSEQKAFEDGNPTGYSLCLFTVLFAQQYMYCTYMTTYIHTYIS